MTDTLEKENFYKAPLKSFCFFPAKTVGIVIAEYEKFGIHKTFDEIKNEIEIDYQKALSEGKMSFNADHIIFSSSILQEQGYKVSITLKLSDTPMSMMYLQYVSFDTPTRETLQDPGKAFESFAYLGSWQSFLKDLADRASHEVWTDIENDSEFYILRQYIKYTFYRLQRERKILIADDKSLAVFNTGLVNSRYEDIFACFVPNDSSENNTPWKFASFCTEAVGYYGKILLSKLHTLPEPARFPTKEAMLDTDKSILIDYEHIILDNISRLPIDYIYPALAGKYPIDVIKDFETFSEILENDVRSYRRIQSDIDIAIVLAKKMVLHDYKVAIPCYYPKRDMITLLLPLYLTYSARPDAALVVEKTSSGNYQGQTVVTLQQAYMNARTVCKLNGTWLDIYSNKEFDEVFK